MTDKLGTSALQNVSGFDGKTGCRLWVKKAHAVVDMA